MLEASDTERRREAEGQGRHSQHNSLGHRPWSGGGGDEEKGGTDSADTVVLPWLTVDNKDMHAPSNPAFPKTALTRALVLLLLLPPPQHGGAGAHGVGAAR